jgi:23S rRNA pseudouridine1911/1915/1917 synthase
MHSMVEQVNAPAIVYQRRSSGAGMVVHPSPGHYTGTLVNAVLHHYSLPAISLQQPDFQFSRLRNSGSKHSDSPAEVQQDDETCDGYEQDEDDDLLSAPLPCPKTDVCSGGLAGYDGAAPASRVEQDAAPQALPQSGNAAVLRPGIVHRLDKGTTGLMVVCRTPVALLRIGEQFRERSVSSTCIFLVSGASAHDACS